MAVGDSDAVAAKFVDIGNIHNGRLTETPNKARKPTAEDTENSVPVIQSATMPPAGADGPRRAR